MSDVNGVNYQMTLNVPVEPVMSKEFHGRVRVIHDTYEAAALAAGQTIGLGLIPKGAKIKSAKILSDALGAGVTLSMGDAGDVDRLITATVFTSAGVGEMDENQIDSGFGYEYTAETELILTVGVGAATGTIKAVIEYTLD